MLSLKVTATAVPHSPEDKKILLLLLIKFYNNNIKEFLTQFVYRLVYKLMSVQRVKLSGTFHLAFHGLDVSSAAYPNFLRNC